MTFQELEAIRQNTLEKYKNFSWKPYTIAGVIVAVLFIFVIAISPLDTLWVSLIFWLGVSIMIFALMYAIIHNKTKEVTIKYNVAYKNYFVLKSLEKFFTNIDYDPRLKLEPGVYIAVMVLGSNWKTSDCFTAKYKGVNFLQADVYTEESDSDSNSTIFKGRFLVFDFNLNFNSNIIACSPGFRGAQLVKFDGPNFKKIKTESTDFNRHFQLYAQDGVDALYILNPTFMEKMQAFHKKIHKPLLLGFVDKKLYIAIDNGQDAFEAPSFKIPLNEQAEFLKIENDIKLITDLVDSLNLDEFSKEKTK